MTIATYNPEDPVRCPHCGESPDSGDVPAEDFVLIGRQLVRSEDQCGRCDGEFVAWRDGDSIKIEAA